MKTRPILIAAAAALALVSCGEKEGGGPETRSSAAAAKVDAPSPLESSYRLKGGEPVDVEALLALLPPNLRPSYESAAFDNKLGATVLVNLRFIDQDPDDKIDLDGFSIERAELYGVDMAAVERVKGAEAAASDAPFEKIFDKVRLYGIRPIEAGQTDAMTIGAAEIDQFRLRQGGFREADENPAFFFNAFDLAGLYLKDVVLNGEEELAGDYALNAPDVRFVSLGGGKLGAVIAKDVNYRAVRSTEARAALARAMGGPAGLLFSGPLKGFIAPERQRWTAESFEWRGVDLSGWMEYGLRGEKPPLTANELIDLGAIKVVGMKSYVDDRLASKTAEASVDDFEFTWLVPSRVRSRSTGAEYDFTAYVSPDEKEAIEILKKHGLDSVKGEGELAWDWDSTKGGAALTSTFKTDNLADFDADFALAGLELARINALIEAGEKSPILKTAAFQGFGLTLADEALLDAIFEMAAFQSGQDSAELRQSAPAMIRLSGMQAATLNPRIADYIDAIANFVAEGGTIELSARPENPVPLSDIEAVGETGPQGLPDLLDLKVTHTKNK